MQSARERKPFGAVDLNVNALAPQIAKAGHSGVSQREGENNTPFTPTNGVLRNQNSDSDQSTLTPNGQIAFDVAVSAITSPDPPKVVTNKAAPSHKAKPPAHIPLPSVLSNNFANGRLNATAPEFRPSAAPTAAAPDAKASTRPSVKSHSSSQIASRQIAPKSPKSRGLSQDAEWALLQLLHSQPSRPAEPTTPHKARISPSPLSQRFAMSPHLLPRGLLGDTPTHSVPSTPSRPRLHMTPSAMRTPSSSLLSPLSRKIVAGTPHRPSPMSSAEGYLNSLAPLIGGVHVSSHFLPAAVESDSNRLVFGLPSAPSSPMLARFPSFERPQPADSTAPLVLSLLPLANSRVASRANSPVKVKTEQILFTSPSSRIRAMKRSSSSPSLLNRVTADAASLDTSVEYSSASRLPFTNRDDTESGLFDVGRAAATISAPSSPRREQAAQFAAAFEYNVLRRTAGPMSQPMSPVRPPPPVHSTYTHALPPHPHIPRATFVPRMLHPNSLPVSLVGSQSGSRSSSPGHFMPPLAFQHMLPPRQFGFSTPNTTSPMQMLRSAPPHMHMPAMHLPPAMNRMAPAFQPSMPSSAGGSLHSSAAPSPRLGPTPAIPQMTPLENARASFSELFASFRSDLAESASTKAGLREFQTHIRSLERSDDAVTAAAVTAHAEHVLNLPSTNSALKWRIAMEVADCFRRRSQLDIARSWYARTHKMQPLAAQAWLEHARLEEEAGDLQRCQSLLSQGLLVCPVRDGLLLKALKLVERMGRPQAARALLAPLRHSPPEKNWKLLLEGAALEARCSDAAEDDRDKVCRAIYAFLMQNASWFGPIYLDAARFEERHEDVAAALRIAEKGLTECARYGPLWFTALRCAEKQSLLNQMLVDSSPSDPVSPLVDRAIENISRELVWKVHFEAAMILERRADFAGARARFAAAVSACPSNLRWKIWMAGARLELHSGSEDRVRIARLLLSQATLEAPAKMKAALMIDCARAEEFTGNVDTARDILQRAQREAKTEWKVFLESVLLEMRAQRHDAAILQARQALRVHSGAGRLWAVLIQLAAQRESASSTSSESGDDIPSSPSGVFAAALESVPKSGEVWCEGARLCMDPSRPQDFDLSLARVFLQRAIAFTPQYGDSFIELLRLELLQCGPGADGGAHLDRLCVNADPNYGAVWFACKQHTTDAAVEVMRRARSRIQCELSEHRKLYQVALLRNQYPNQDFTGTIDDKAAASWRSSHLSSLDSLYPNMNAQSPADRHKILFGADPIVP